MWNYVLILHILHSACRRLRPIIIGIVGILYAKNGVLSVVDIRNRRKCWRLEVTVVRHRYTVMLCRFLSRWKHVDDQSEQRVGVVVSVLRFAIVLYARQIIWRLRAVAVPPVSGYLPVLWRARVVMSTCCTETNAHAHRAFRCNGFFCSYELWL